ECWRVNDYEWTGGDLPTFVTHLECGLTGERYEADVIQGLSKAGRPLLVRYDLAAVAGALTKEMLATRPQTLWRYRELLPVRRPENVVSLGEIATPLISLPRVAQRLGASGAILVKDAGRLPPRSLRARRARHGRVEGEETRNQDHGEPDQRQCRCGHGGVWRARRDEGLCLLPGRHA